VRQILGETRLRSRGPRPELTAVEALRNVSTIMRQALVQFKLGGSRLLWGGLIHTAVGLAGIVLLLRAWDQVLSVSFFTPACRMAAALTRSAFSPGSACAAP